MSAIDVNIKKNLVKQMPEIDWAGPHFQSLIIVSIKTDLYTS